MKKNIQKDIPEKGRLKEKMRRLGENTFTCLAAAALAGELAIGGCASYQQIKPANPGCSYSYIFESSHQGRDYNVLVCERANDKVLIAGEKGNNLVYLKEKDAGKVPGYLVLDSPKFWPNKFQPLSYRWNEEIIDYFEKEVDKK